MFNASQIALANAASSANHAVRKTEFDKKAPIFVANYAALPGTGNAGQIYVAIDTGVQYQWKSGAYAAIGGGGEVTGYLPLEGGTMDSGAVIAFANGTSIRANPGGTGIDSVCSAELIHRWREGRLWLLESDGTTVKRVISTFDEIPGTGHDDSQGFVVGSAFESRDGTSYICTSAATGAATWQVRALLHCADGAFVNSIGGQDSGPYAGVVGDASKPYQTAAIALAAFSGSPAKLIFTAPGNYTFDIFDAADITVQALVPGVNLAVNQTTSGSGSIADAGHESVAITLSRDPAADAYSFTLSSVRLLASNIGGAPGYAGSTVSQNGGSLTGNLSMIGGVGANAGGGTDEDGQPGFDGGSYYASSVRFDAGATVHAVGGAGGNGDGAGGTGPSGGNGSVIVLGCKGIALTSDSTIARGLDPEISAEITHNGFFGVANGSDAGTGKIGQYVFSLIPYSYSVSLTTNTARDVTSINLTAGDWDVEGIISFQQSGATVTGKILGLSATSATLPADGTEVYNATQSSVLSVTDGGALPRKRFSLSGSTTIYLVAKAIFSAGTVGAFGSISARRVR